MILENHINEISSQTVSAEVGESSSRQCTCMKNKKRSERADVSAFHELKRENALSHFEEEIDNSSDPYAVNANTHTHSVYYSTYMCLCLP